MASLMEATILGRRPRATEPETVAVDSSNLHMHVCLLVKRDMEHRQFNVSGVAIMRESGGITVDIVRKAAEMPKTPPVATIEGTLIHRPNHQFCEACDMISQEVMDMCIALFDHRGLMEDALLQTVTNHELSNTGGLFYITSIDVIASARGKDIGLIFLHEVLKASRNQWTLAVTFPAPLRYDDKPGIPFETVVEKMGRYFSRAGFVQVCGDRPHGLNKYWVLEKELLPETTRSKADVASLTVNHAPRLEKACDDGSGDSALTAELVDAICKSSDRFLLDPGPAAPEDDTGRLRTKLRDIVSRGGDVNAARCLHYAVANQKSHLIPMLINEFGAIVDQQDDSGFTALHCSATMLYVEGMKSLVAFGANKFQKSKEGETPVNMLKKSKKDSEKAWRGVGLLKQPSIVALQKSLDECITLLS